MKINSQEGAVARDKNLRNKGRLHTTGKLYRGCVQQASSKVFIGCIPANYETIVYRVQSVKSFGSSQSRFNAGKQTTPGPGHYFDAESQDSTQLTFPHQGTSSMLSKTRRGYNPTARGNVMLGPGRYDIQGSFIKKPSDELKFYAFNFQHRELKATRPKPQPLPGPGQYNVSPEAMERYRQTYKSAFRSKQVRKMQATQGPGPCQYNSLVPKKLTRRYIFPEAKPKEINKPALLLQAPQDKTLGPGSYNLDPPDFTPHYERVKNSGNFIEGLKDKFGQNAPEYEQLKRKVVRERPGPCDYFQTVDQQPIPAKESCVFASKTVRKAIEPKKDAMGPNLQEVCLPGKKDFRLYLDDEWV